MSTMTGLWLSDAEIDDMCRPLKQPSAQVRFLRMEKHLHVETKANGRPLVIRSHAEAVLSGRADKAAPGDAETPAAEPQPNIDGFMKLVQGGKRHGSSKKVQPA